MHDAQLESKVLRTLKNYYSSDRYQKQGLGLRGVWLNGKFSSLYLKAWKKYISGLSQDFVVVSNFAVLDEYQHQGIARSLLTLLEDRGWNIYVECVLNPNFAGFLKRRGYIHDESTGWIQEGENLSPSFYLLSNTGSKNSLSKENSHG